MLHARRLSTRARGNLDGFTLPEPHLPEYCRPAMHFGAREIVASISAAALILCCSCEKHRLGEDPEVQREKEGNVATANKAETVESPAAKRTPAEFFRQESPSPSP